MFGGSLVTECLNVHTVWYARWLKVIEFHRKQYSLPGGAIGRDFVDQLADEIDALAKGRTRSEQIIVFSAVLLQKDPHVKKTCDVRRLLNRRLRLWREGHFDELLQEAVRCDMQLRRAIDKRTRTPIDEVVHRVFTRLMLQGKVREAVRWITNRESGGILSPDDHLCSEGNSKSVLELLREKHPHPQEPNEEVLRGIRDSQLPLQVEIDVTASHVEHVARRIKGGAGPGGCDSNQWHNFLLRYGAHSEKLRDNVASLARRLSNTLVEWEDISALMANRLIALDKCPGVRPIGIGECLRRILGKCIVLVTGPDVEEICNSAQLCSGVQAGIEGAVHSMGDLFTANASKGWGMLLVDASNAFNSINRMSALMNARAMWPRCSRFLFNTYRGHATLKVQDATELLYSREGVTQGDPLSMLMYSLAVMPLIRSLKTSNQEVTQNWYADDASATGKLTHLRDWLQTLTDEGPAYGYFPEPKKSFLVVKPEFLIEAKSLFEREFGVQVVSGKRFLGGFVGEGTERNAYVKQKVDGWCSAVRKLAHVAASQPQAAFAALTKSLQFEWAYLQRVIPDCAELFQPLEDALRNEFLPALLGQAISNLDRSLFSLPARLGGLGLRNPTQTASLSHSTSKTATKVLSVAIQQGQSYNGVEHRQQLQIARNAFREEQGASDATCLENVLATCDPKRHRAIKRIANEKTSSWLTVLPISRDNFDLSSVEFRDALSLRYHLPLLRAPANCDGCGQRFDTSHALKCKKGGLIITRHNEIRDAVGDLSSLVWSNVHREPIVREADDARNLPALVADLGVRGVWQPQDLTLLDIRVIDTDAQSYVPRPVNACLTSAENQKKTKYSSACEERHVSFTPFVTSIDGALGPEAKSFMRRLDEKLATKWKMPYSRVVSWTRTRLSFAILRATSHCLRGTRTKWRSLNILDGCGIGHNY
jgi:hypothetical protein